MAANWRYQSSASQRCSRTSPRLATTTRRIRRSRQRLRVHDLAAAQQQQSLELLPRALPKTAREMAAAPRRGARQPSPKPGRASHSGKIAASKGKAGVLSLWQFGKSGKSLKLRFFGLSRLSSQSCPRSPLTDGCHTDSPASLALPRLGSSAPCLTRSRFSVPPSPPLFSLPSSSLLPLQLPSSTDSPPRHRHVLARDHAARRAIHDVALACAARSFSHASLAGISGCIRECCRPCAGACA